MEKKKNSDIIYLYEKMRKVWTFMNLKFQKKDIITIPNLLSFFRIVLIPVIVILYCKYNMYSATTLAILISGLTDVVDGWIARRFHMISDFGKILDPIADKLTQASILLCLFTRFRHMIYLFALMAVKETLMGVTGLLSIRSSGEVQGADWHGKLTTCVLYAVLLVHIVWHDISMHVSDMLLTFVSCAMLFSLIMYVMRNVHVIREHQE